MSTPDQDAARALTGQAHDVTYAPGPPWWQRLAHRVTRGRLYPPRGGQPVEDLGTPWQDHPSYFRAGWRTRSGHLLGDDAVALEYAVCPACRLGWISEPRTLPQYRRCGLASAALATLRTEHPGISWHTLGGHIDTGPAFWPVVGRGVPGGYQPRQLCPHVPR